MRPPSFDGRMYVQRSAQQGIQVGLRRGDGGDTELLHQVVEHVGREEGGEGGAQADVADAQVQ